MLENNKKHDSLFSKQGNLIKFPTSCFNENSTFFFSMTNQNFMSTTKTLRQTHLQR